MDPVSVLPAIAASAVAAATAKGLSKMFGAPPTQGRFASIDGLRGYLAFFVFLHHTCIWYFYLRSGKWEPAPSNVYTHFGQSSVALFFMITSFLFFSKIIEGRSKGIDWRRLYVSRFLRLTPLYFFVISVMFLLVLIVSNGAMNEPASKLAMGMLRWIFFSVLGEPDINGIEGTRHIVAGVTWSLRFEWLFYFSLPVIAMIVGVKPPLTYVCFGVIFAAYAAMHPSIHYLSFAGGILAACLVRLEFVRRLAVGGIPSFIAISCLISTVVFFPWGYEVAPISLLTVFFIIIASGNTLFGLLSVPASRTLGEFAYGIYLMHGIIIYITFNFVLGLPAARALSAMQHWMVVLGVTPVLVFVCFLLYTFIERPAMQKTADLTAWLHTGFGGRIRVKAQR
jgi:peptidoglycan/LPS O-acetylase OafA/YrhL